LFGGKLPPFCSSPRFVVNKRASKKPVALPKIETPEDDSDIICLKLAKAGYCGGNPETISKMNVVWVIKMLEYEGFCSDYEEEYINLNSNNG